jgi:hypothetical protein
MSLDFGSIEFKDYKDESQLEHVMKLVTTDLSEPYSSTILQSVVFFVLYSNSISCSPVLVS